MRRRRVKGALEELFTYEKFVIRLDDESDCKSKIEELFEKKVHLELGIGRGAFITEKASRNKDINYLGLEIKEEVLIKAVEKADRLGLNNVKFMLLDIGRIEEFFKERKFDKIYINFCDPWPKKRHGKRRLTHSNFLEKYKRITNPGSLLEFKTDNEELYEFSINEFATFGLKFVSFDLDLHNREDLKDNVMTEYEKRYTARGMKIYRVKARI